MNLRKSGRTLVLAAAVAVLAMGLQGCGGDDGVSQSRLDEEIAKAAAADAAKTKAEADKAKADKARMAAEEATDAARKATTEAQAATAAAKKAEMAAKEATVAAQNSPENAALKKAVEDARAELKRLQEVAREAEMKAEEARDHAMAEKLLVAMEKASGRATPSRFSDITANTTGLTLKSSTLTVTYAGYKQNTTTEGRPRELAGWSGATLERVADTGDKIVVYSNQPTQKKFFRDRYTRKTIPGQSEVAYAITTDGGGSTINNNIFNDVLAANTTNVTYAGNTHTITVTVDGVPGKVRCVGAGPRLTDMGPCALARVNKETDNRHPPRYAYSLPGSTTIGNWTFVPNDANAFSYDPYLFFGWWMDVAPPAGSEDFDTFYMARGSDGQALAIRTAANTMGSDLGGTARYTGGAAGRYAIRALGEANGSRSGDFVADVTLNVDFDVDPTPANTTNNDTNNGITLSGTIDKFRADYTGSDKWVVTLSADGGTAAGVQPLGSLNPPSTTYTTKWGVMGSTIPLGDGKWTVDFYGGANTAAPDSAAGRFAAGASNRAILMGAFGATKQTSGQ